MKRKHFYFITLRQGRASNHQSFAVQLTPKQEQYLIYSTIFDVCKCILGLLIRVCQATKTIQPVAQWAAAKIGICEDDLYDKSLAWFRQQVQSEGAAENLQESRAKMRHKTYD